MLGGKRLNKILYIVIPCFNEEEALPRTAKQLKEKFDKLFKEQKISYMSRIVFVNDGSRDNTWEIIKKLNKENEIFSGINLSSNTGHQNALLAGLLTVKEKADMVITMDADLQDDINAIDEMINAYNNGADIVYGVRSDRKKDSFFKRNTAKLFYKIMRFLGVNTVYNHADFRLMSRRAVEALENFKEVNLFLRGLVTMLGFKTEKVYYERKERVAGESKYPIKKMINFALEGITSLSIKPIRMIIVLGFTVFLVSIGIVIYSLVRHFTGHTVTGWTSVMASVWAIGGLMLLAIGVVGEYIGKIYLETKQRPRFIIEENLEENFK